MAASPLIPPAAATFSGRCCPNGEVGVGGEGGGGVGNGCFGLAHDGICLGLAHVGLALGPVLRH